MTASSTNKWKEKIGIEGGKIIVNLKTHINQKLSVASQF